ncbi:hypothetical protein PHYBOEH_005939 [Phytophthora boehmeriae]|uniref:M96 mating-specific protein family n=1 Tax=Phytophthora boehmeriae TaxID=109152 RepID=A0A8T1WND2_9STRA|nr:hypothetical protein PHYBOEH_005939 [Phytophthora boehmeriae]
MSVIVTELTLPQLKKRDNMQLELMDLDESYLLAEAETLMASLPSVAVHTMFQTAQDADLDSAGISDSDKNSIAEAQEVYKRRMYRERRKNERQYLRCQEIELSRDLVRLRQAKEDKRRKFNASRSPAYFVWKAIATQEQEQRLLAEAEQQQLAMMVGAQATYIQSMTVRAKTARDQENALCDTKRQRVGDTEVALCNAYIRQLESYYERFDELMDECGIADLPETESIAHSVHRGSDGEVEYFQRLHQYVEPHPLHRTAVSLWELGEKKFRGRGQHEKCVAVPDPANTVVMKFREATKLETGATVSLLHRHIVRRWSEDDRILVAWVTVTEGEGPFNGMCIEETGFVRIRPSTRTESPGTQIEICARQAPMHFKSRKPLGCTIAKQFHTVTENLSQGNATEVIHSMENLLSASEN